MAHPNEREFLRRFLEQWPIAVDGRVLEIGSADYGHGVEYRSLFPDRAVVGVDLEPRAGVDVCCDMTGDCSELDDERFAAVLCCSVLEHCEQPWTLAANVVRHLRPNGLLYVSVPWIWRFHPYPNDLWRFSVEGIKRLFPSIQWKRIAYATQQSKEFLSESQAYGGCDWVREERGDRVFLTSQLACMIGRALA